jgi:hypothetical protein
VRRFIYAALRSFGALDQRLRERLTLAGWLVLGVGLCVVALDLMRARFAKPRRASRPTKTTLVASKPAA